MLTNKELLGTLITDLNNLVKEQNAGQYIQACTIIVSMSQKLVNLMKTIDDDLKNRDETIASLKEQLRNAGIEIVEFPASELLKENKDE